MQRGDYCLPRTLGFRGEQGLLTGAGFFGMERKHSKLRLRTWLHAPEYSEEANLDPLKGELFGM